MDVISFTLALKEWNGIPVKGSWVSPQPLAGNSSYSRRTFLQGPSLQKGHAMPCIPPPLSSIAECVGDKLHSKKERKGCSFGLHKAVAFISRSLCFVNEIDDKLVTCGSSQSSNHCTLFMGLYDSNNNHNKDLGDIRIDIMGFLGRKVMPT